MGWNANGYRKFARSFVLIRGVTYLRPASQELNLAPMLINNMACHRRGVGTVVKLVPTVLLEFLPLGPKPRSPWRSFGECSNR